MKTTNVITAFKTLNMNILDWVLVPFANVNIARLSQLKLTTNEELKMATKYFGCRSQSSNYTLGYDWFIVVTT